MPNENNASTTRFAHQIFQGTTWHSRLLPSVHKFTYPYRYWGVNISALSAGQALPEVAGAITYKSKLLDKLPTAISSLNKLLAKGLPLFSAKHKALQQFYANDYLQGLELTLPSHQPCNDDKGVEGLLQRLNLALTEKTGSAPSGDIIGLVVCRNVGIYFSPVNFYLGFDEEQKPTHLLAEVSNTPWDKRHYYGFLLEGEQTEFCHNKDFHVSPFNPIDQLYRWQVSVKAHNSNLSSSSSSKSIANTTDINTNSRPDVFDIRIAINISDERGEVLKTGVKMSGEPMSASTIRESLKRNPLMNVTSLTRIYWHAFKLYALKKVPYINYDEKLADSEQGSDTN